MGADYSLLLDNTRMLQVRLNALNIALNSGKEAMHDDIGWFSVSSGIISN